MDYAAASFAGPDAYDRTFTAHHFAHIAARDEANRLARINAEARRLVNRKAR